MKSDPKPKAAGYIRVSSKVQADHGESLVTQSRAIKAYIQGQSWHLTNIYEDAGISGGSIEKRLALKKLMADGAQGEFTTVVIHRLSRFGRNAKELLQNVDALRDAGIALRSIKENIDFSTSYGKAMLTMLAAIAELEKEIISEQSIENKIARCKSGVPAVGKLAVGRTFDRATGKWGIDKDKVKLIQWAAKEFLKGGSLREIAETLKREHGLALGYHHLIRVFKERCGDTWTLNFKGEDPITYKVHRILDEKTIEAIKAKLIANRTQNRTDIRKYVLTGFLRCAECGKTLAGQTQKRGGREWPYYRHQRGKWESCKAMSAIDLKKIEGVVFRTIFENTADEEAYNKAIAENFPDKKAIVELEKELKAKEKKRDKVEESLDNLAYAVSQGTLSKLTIKKTEQDFKKQRQSLTDEIAGLNHKLAFLPDPEQIQEAGTDLRDNILGFCWPNRSSDHRPNRPTAEQIKQSIHDYFGSRRWLSEMYFDEKRAFLDSLFHGKDEGGRHLGIYLKKAGKGWEVEFNARGFAGWYDLDIEPFAKDTSKAKRSYTKIDLKLTATM